MATRTRRTLGEDFPYIEAGDVDQALLYAAHSAEVTTLPLRENWRLAGLR